MILTIAAALGRKMERIDSEVQVWYGPGTTISL
jgi:hypothetical protein